MLLISSREVRRPSKTAPRSFFFHTRTRAVGSVFGQGILPPQQFPNAPCGSTKKEDLTPSMACPFSGCEEQDNKKSLKMHRQHIGAMRLGVERGEKNGIPASRLQTVTIKSATPYKNNVVVFPKLAVRILLPYTSALCS